jgi:hypothetical protein
MILTKRYLLILIKNVQSNLALTSTQLYDDYNNIKKQAIQLQNCCEYTIFGSTKKLNYSDYYQKDLFEENIIQLELIKNVQSNRTSLILNNIEVKTVFVNLNKLNDEQKWNGNILDYFLYECHFTDVIFFNGSDIKTIGRCWMTGCKKLINASFLGLSALQTVGDFWMYECKSLVNPSFEGLSALQTVGTCWMYNCKRLENPSFLGLSALQTVGDNWMSNCKKLVNASFSGLSALQTVGNYWMTECKSLVNPSFSGLSALQTVGNCWMCECNSLVNPSFLGLSALQTIGNYWMSYCNRLVNPSFEGSKELEKIYIKGGARRPTFYI